MYDQPKYDVQEESAFFADHRAMRPLVAGVVSTEEETDVGVAQGRLDDQSGYVLTIPASVTASFAAGTAGGVLGPPVTSTLDMRAPGVRRSGPVRGVVSSAAVALAQRLAQRLAASGVGLTPPVQLGLGV